MENLNLTNNTEESVKDTSQDVGVGNPRVLDLYVTQNNAKTHATPSQPGIKDILMPGYIPSLLLMYSRSITNSLLQNIMSSNLVNYLFYDSNYLHCLMKLDSQLLESKIQNERIDPLKLKKMYICDQMRSPVYFNDTQEGVIDSIIYDSPKFSIAENNTFLNNGIYFCSQEMVDENYMRSGQYDTAISIFNIEKTGWDATAARLRRNNFETFKMSCMRHMYLLPMRHLNYIREAIGRIVVNRNRRTDFFVPKRLVKFSYNPLNRDEDEITQKKKFFEKHPLGFMEDIVSSSQLLVGSYEVNDHTAEYMRQLSKIKVKIYGYDTPEIFDIPESEIYISRATSMDEFCFEYRCLIGYLLYNPKPKLIHMVNPLLTNEQLDRYFKNLICREVIYTGVSLPAIQIYQFFLTRNLCSVISPTINKCYTNDMFTILKGTTIHNMKIKLDNDNYMHILDYSKAQVMKTDFEQYKNPRSRQNIHIQDSYYVLRILGVLGLVTRTDCAEIEVPRRFVEIRNYMREFARIMATCSDYIIQRTVGSLDNRHCCESTTYALLEDVAKLVIFAGFGSNIGTDEVGNCRFSLIKNSLIWHDTYMIIPDERFLDPCQYELKVTRRLDWDQFGIYVNVGCWNFGNIYEGKKFDHNVRDYDIFLADNYREIRNACIRYSIVDGASIKMGIRDNEGLRYGILSVRGAIRNTLGTKGYCNKFYHFCEIPTLLIFSLTKHFFIHNVYYNNVLPTYRIGWLNTYDYYLHYTNLYATQTTADALTDLFLKAK